MNYVTPLRDSRLHRATVATNPSSGVVLTGLSLPPVARHRLPRDAAQDLGHLAWVLEDVRKSLTYATNVVRRLEWDIKNGANLAARNHSDAQIALSQLDQSAGALEMVGHQHPAKLVLAMGKWIRNVINQPDTVSEDSTTVFEGAARAALDYFEGHLKGSLASPVALFVQYRAMAQLAGNDRTHPADLWIGVERWEDFEIESTSHTLPIKSVERGQLDQSLLSVLQHFDSENARCMVDLCIELARSCRSAPVQTFWSIAAAFFEALCLGELPNDVYVRRTAARIIPAYRLLAEGQTTALSGLVHELLFYCAFAKITNPTDRDANALVTVRKRFGLDFLPPLYYEAATFGRFDPAQLAKIRKYISAAAEGWTALSSGDVGRSSAVAAQFGEVGAAVLQLHPQNEALVSALIAAVDATASMARVPSPAVAIEVATAVLYLEVAYDDLDLANHIMEQRSLRLAARLHHVAGGGEPLPIERWMEALYRRVGDRKMMGTVVGELAQSLAEIEQAVESFVRDPSECSVLETVPVALGHMRGVFSVLGLDQAALAALRMRSTVECLLAPQGVALDTAKKWSLHLVNSLSAMGFLIDMLRYQPAMAKEFFEYDESAHEFRLIMERAQGRAPTEREIQAQAIEMGEAMPSVPQLVNDHTASPVSLHAQPEMLRVASEANALASDDIADEEIQNIFLSEAGQVVDEGKASIIALGLAPANLAALGSLRRAFHTLKGSARMVGFQEFGEASWAFEQLLNAWLESKRPAKETLLTLCENALSAMAAWIESISQGKPPIFLASDFRLCADTLRLEDRYVPYTWPQASDQGGTAPSMREPMSITPGEMLMPESAFKLESASLYLGALPDAHGERNTAVNVISIGSLHVRLDIFEVFINEAGPWVDQLQLETQNWSTPLTQAVVEKAAGLAHALQGSAGAVGFVGLAVLAQAIERSLEHLVLHALSVTNEKEVFCDASQEAKRLLDAFANGELHEPMPATLDALASLMNDWNEKFGETEQSVSHSLAAPSPERHLDEHTESAVSALTTSPETILASTTVAQTPLELDGFESPDVLDTDLWPVFLEEGTELLQGLVRHAHLWVAQPQELHLRAQILRTLHTLKGSARLVGALRLGELAHQMESAVEQVTVNHKSNSEEVIPILRCLGPLEAMFGQLTLQFDADALVQEAKPELARGSASALTLVNPAANKRPASINTAIGASIRVRAQVLDRLIDQAGEVMTSRTRMDQHFGQLDNSLTELGRSLNRLQHQLRDLEIQTELQMQSRQSPSPQSSQLFDPLELDRFTALQEVSRMMAESVADVEALHKGLQSEVEGAQEDLLGQGRRAKELTHGLLRLRLVEFESISDRLYGVVRQAAKETGKQVRLDIEGGSIKMDRGVLDRMTPSFEHMLRNSVVHGIESPDIRVAAGKPAIGTLTIFVQQDGSDVVVRFVDDGAGLQLERIRTRAIHAKLLEANQPMSYEQATKLIFLPGFSTAENVTELAGRGIGMDIILSDISAIGGRIEISAQAEGGTSFELVFPLTTSVTQIVLLRMDTVTVGVPANLLETVLRMPQERIKEAYSTGALRQDSKQEIPFFWAGAILGISSRGQLEKTGARQQSVAVIRSAGQRVALHVDEVLGNREVVVKNMGTQLSKLPGLVGISVLASGAVVLIYNPVALMSVYGDALRRADFDAQSGRATIPSSDGVWSDSNGLPERTAPLVLVVDDSITVRRVTQRLLARAGFRVALAADGIQALDLLRDERPALVLSDIEMPRMDGMELTRQIRADASLSEIPIIVITSRTALKHRDHAIALGANHYLGKPYAEAELLELVRSHCTVAEFT